MVGARGIPPEGVHRIWRCLLATPSKTFTLERQGRPEAADARVAGRKLEHAWVGNCVGLLCRVEDCQCGCSIALENSGCLNTYTPLESYRCLIVVWMMRIALQTLGISQPASYAMA